jgi:molecular chaperone DnaK (HSP70)
MSWKERTPGFFQPPSKEDAEWLEELEAKSLEAQQGSDAAREAAAQYTAELAGDADSRREAEGIQSVKEHFDAMDVTHPAILARVTSNLEAGYRSPHEEWTRLRRARMQEHETPEQAVQRVVNDPDISDEEADRLLDDLETHEQTLEQVEAQIERTKDLEAAVSTFEDFEEVDDDEPVDPTSFVYQ